MSKENENKAENEPIRTVKGRNGGTLVPIPKGKCINNNSARVGLQTRSTIFNKWMNFATSGIDPDGTIANMQVQEKIILAQVKKALEGDTASAIFLFDGTYGKVKEVAQQGAPQQSIDYSKFSPEELEVMDKAQRIMASKMNELRNGSVQDAEIVE